MAMNHDVSVIIPVLNEVATIQQTIDHIFSLPRQGGLEVIVVDGDPDGETVRAVQNSEVKKLTGGGGRSGQMNIGASAASHPVLLFLHADTLLPEDAFAGISHALEERAIVGGAFDLGIQSDRTVFRVIEGAASLRSRITRVPYGDQAIFVRRDYFDALGGFSEIPLMEDVDLMRRIKRAGDRIQIIPSQVMTSPRRWEREGVTYCTLRNWTLMALYSFGVAPEKLTRFYK